MCIFSQRIVDIRVSNPEHHGQTDRHDRSTVCQGTGLCFANEHNLQFLPFRSDCWADFRPSRKLGRPRQYAPNANYLPIMERQKDQEIINLP